MTARATIAVQVGEDTVTVHELTFAEVRAWLVEAETAGLRDPLHVLAFDEIGLDELARMTDRRASELEAYTPSALAPVVSAARRLNRFFFRVRVLLVEAQRRVADAPLPDSTEPPPS